MNSYSEILRYMGHSGEVSTQLEEMISSCREKLASVCAPHHVTMQLPCTVDGNRISIGALDIESAFLAAYLSGCEQVYMLAATLGSSVDRLIAQRVKIDSAEALCLQACAASQIEEYCNRVEQKLSCEIEQQGMYLRPRFSPGYSDFDIAHQTDLLHMLQAHKRIGLSETKSHMLTPLKSVTAVIGISAQACPSAAKDKCAGCIKADCQFSNKEFEQ